MGLDQIICQRPNIQKLPAVRVGGLFAVCFLFIEKKNKTQIIFISLGLFFFFLLFYRITKGIENYTNIYHNCVYVLFGVWFLFKLRAPRLIGLAFCIWRNTSRVACDFKPGKLRYVFVMMGHVLEKIKKEKLSSPCVEDASIIITSDTHTFENPQQPGGKKNTG
jgi:hypothetical protein